MNNSTETNIPRPEYPRPEFVRDNWVNLNGEWDFEIDYACSGQEKKFYNRNSLDSKIIVPFCPESKLSGIENKDFMPCVWYRRNIEIPDEHKGSDIILHFGAVDYYAIVYVNGEKVTEHKGGYTLFSANITEYLKDSDNYITLCAYDDIRSHNQPGGKQSFLYDSHDCYYTRTTGIWQTVWMEFVNKARIDSVKITTNTDEYTVTIGLKSTVDAVGKDVLIETFWDSNATGALKTHLSSTYTEITIALTEKHLWKVGKGGLYDLKLTLFDGNNICDSVSSYFGVRSVYLNKRAFMLNGKSVFGRWVLDQGFYPDGIYTAPSDNALKADIEYSMQLGFNGARMHEKVFEPRYLYWADKLGYIVWGEHANWGLQITEPGQILHFLPEWIEAVERDFNHPSVIGWCPFNETWDWNNRKQCDAIIETVYRTTKAIDPTRPVIDTSGNFHIVTDIFDIHDYEQDPKKFAYNRLKTLDGIVGDTTERNPIYNGRQKYDGVSPFFISEYGGILWSPSQDDSWGYGTTPKTQDEFVQRYKALTEIIMNNEIIMGFCYTQLYDVEQERNGLMTYNRKFKFDPEIFREINSRIAAIEK